MLVLIFESNLMWSSKLSRSLKALGHQVQVHSSIPSPIPAAQVAIINLGDRLELLESLTRTLHRQGTYVIAHAGHKEKQLLEVGKELAVDKLTTNSELTYKIEEILDDVPITS